ncbi:hypothetical protein CYMTET_26208, partial [Cymbomonas tetramitiformis]
MLSFSTSVRRLCKRTRKGSAAAAAAATTQCKKQKQNGEAGDRMGSEASSEYRFVSPLQKQNVALPKELLIGILSNLSAQELATACQVSHEWRRAASAPEIWQGIYLKTYGYSSPQRTRTCSWRMAFLRRNVEEARKRWLDCHKRREIAGEELGRLRLFEAHSRLAVARAVQLVDRRQASCNSFSARRGGDSSQETEERLAEPRFARICSE